MPSGGVHSITPVPKGTAMDTCELTLTDLLADPMTLAVMAADRVDPAALVAALSGLARRLEFARPAASGRLRRRCLRRTRR
jgi:hypothetical protein